MAGGLIRAMGQSKLERKEATTMIVIRDAFLNVWSIWTTGDEPRHVADYATEAAARAALLKHR